MLMAHASKNFKSLDDLFNSKVTLSVVRGLPFVGFLEKKYGFKNVKVVPYAGGVASFLNDENFAQQGFISSEPLIAEKKGTKVSTFMVSSTGFNPYVVVLAVSGKTLKEKPALVKAMVAATREGWAEYLKNPKPTQELIAKLNPTMDVATQTEMLAVESKLVKPANHKEPLGNMSEARWKTLVEQLFELKLIKQKVEASSLYRNL